MLSTLFDLLFATERIFLALLLFIVFKRFLAIPFLIKNTKVKLALVIPADAPITVENEAIKALPINADKTNKVLSK